MEKINFSDCHRKKTEDRKRKKKTKLSPLMSDHIFSEFLQKNLIWQNTGQAGTEERLSAGVDATNAGQLP